MNKNTSNNDNIGSVTGVEKDYVKAYLSDISDYDKYLSSIISMKNENILLMVAVRDTPGLNIPKRFVELWKEIGFRCDLTDKHWHGYAAATNFKNLYLEKIGGKGESVQIETDADSKTHIKLFSSPFRAANKAEIKINGEEFSDNFRGLNIVVYDLDRHMVLDVACFDTHIKTVPCARKYTVHPISGIKNRLKLSEILPVDDIDRFYQESDNIVVSDSKKTEVRIYFYGFAGIWNSLRSVAQSFAEDDRFNLKVISSYDTDGNEKKLKVVREDGIEVVDSRDYNIEKDNVDIWITNAWHSNVFKQLDFRKKGKMRIVATSGLVNGALPQEEVQRHFKFFTEVFDYVLVEKVLYNDFVAAGVESENLVQMGNPKFDSIYKAVSEKKELTPEWQKLKGKKVILWATDHVWNTSNVTFDLYIRKLLEYFKDRTDIALVVRPHNMYVREMIYEKIWNEKDKRALQCYFEQSPNLIWDETPDYARSYQMCDAVLTDVNCGITVSALVLDKPLAVLYRDDGSICIPKNEELSERLYQLYDFDDLKDFIEMVAEGKDVKASDRREMFDKYITSFDGKNGKRIKDFITEKYLEKFDN